MLERVKVMRSDEEKVKSDEVNKLYRKKWFVKKSYQLFFICDDRENIENVKISCKANIFDYINFIKQKSRWVKRGLFY